MTSDEALAWVDLCSGPPSKELATMTDYEIQVKLAQSQVALAAEVRRYQQMRCDTCKYEYWPGPMRRFCRLTRYETETDHGCRKWVQREGEDS